MTQHVASMRSTGASGSRARRRWRRCSDGTAALDARVAAAAVRRAARQPAPRPRGPPSCARPGRGFYTIGSAGHEANAAVAAALRPTDPALLHYRSGAFYLARAAQVPGSTPLRDVLLGLVAAADEPIAGGRHKVFGNADLAVIPQTSTIASHLPRAVGVAFAIDRAGKLGVVVALAGRRDRRVQLRRRLGQPLDRDRRASTRPCHVAHQGLPMPVLFVCEDNGLGISVPTPAGWIAAAYGQRPGLRYFTADGSDLAAAFDAARRGGGARPGRPRAGVPAPARASGSWATPAPTRRPPTAARPSSPRTTTATRCSGPPGCSLGAGLLTPDEVCSRGTTMRCARCVPSLPRRRRAPPARHGGEEILAPLAPRHPATVARAAAVAAGADDAPAAGSPASCPRPAGRSPSPTVINRALADALAALPASCWSSARTSAARAGSTA